MENNKKNYAIPRLKKLLYRNENSISEELVIEAMKEFSEIEGATKQEKSKAKSLLIRVAKRDCNIDIVKETKKLGLEGWTKVELFAMHEESHRTNDRALHYDAMLSLVDGYGIFPNKIEENNHLDDAWQDITLL